MENQDEQFFEHLAAERHEDEENYEIQLAKTSGGATSQIRRSSTKESADTEGKLTIDVYQTPDAVIVESAIAGVKPEDLDITATTDSVTIRGERHHEDSIKDEDYFYQECFWGAFSRSIMLPQEVDAENAVVNFKNGILTIRLPKLTRAKSKKLKVKLD